MKFQQFLQHHGIHRNPFAEEDAQTDPVFKDHCIISTFHPTWDKVYGDPTEPATSIVFGEKGSGKTAMRLQIARHLAQHNTDHPDAQVFVIQYDDFNPYLDRFRGRMSKRRRRADRMLAEWKLWDHMDAILSIGVTMLTDHLLHPERTGSSTSAARGMGNLQIQESRLDGLDRHQKRDLLLLAACYDESTAETTKGRWHRLRRRLGFSTWKSQWDLAMGWLGTAAWITLLVTLLVQGYGSWLMSVWYWLLMGGLLAFPWSCWLWRNWKCYLKAKGILTRMRVGNHETNPLRQILMQFSGGELASQPLPSKESTDDRYELLLKLQGLLQTLGFAGIIVLVDRIDEPHAINGSAELMKALVWPMLDNKFLKHPGLGLKLMLPVELRRFVDREGRDFYQRARLDKQNMVPSFEWTPESLYDVANARLRACGAPDADVPPTLQDLFDEEITRPRIMEALRGLRVPRHLFKFMYRVCVEHCNAHTDQDPVWQISARTFDTTLAVFQREQDAYNPS